MQELAAVEPVQGVALELITPPRVLGDEAAAAGTPGR